MNKVFSLLFLFGLVTGQLGGVPLGGGITVYLQDIFLLMLIVYAAFQLPKRLPFVSLRIPILLFGAACMVSLFANATRFAPQEVAISALYAIRWVAYSSLYIITFVLPQQPIWWMWGLYCVGSVVAALGLIQYEWYPYLRNLSYLGWDPHLYRVFSTLLDPNFASILFVLTLWLGIYLWQQSKQKWLVVCLQLITFVAFLLTYSRSGYLALIAGIITFAIFSKRGLIAVVIIAVFVGSLFLLPHKDGEGVKLLRTVSTAARLGNWQRGMALISEAPLLGHGFNTLRYVQRQKGWVDDSVMVSHAGAGLDNSLEFVWATSGILGFGIFAWLYSRMIAIAMKATRHSKNYILGIVCVASFVSVLVDSQFSNSLFFPQIAMWIWILVGSLEKKLSFGKSRGARP